MFGVLLTQLNVGGMGGVAGINYAVLPFLFQMYEVPPEDTKFYFDKLMVICNYAVSKLNKK